MRLRINILKIPGRVKNIQPIQGCYTGGNCFSMGSTHGYSYSTPFGVGSFRIDNIVLRLLKFYKAGMKLKNASSNPFIDYAFPLASLKGLNVHNHGRNPWSGAPHFFNDPERVGTFSINIFIAGILKFYNAITRLKNASSNTFIYNALQLASLKGLNINNHGWNPWIKASQGYNNPEGVDSFSINIFIAGILKFYNAITRLKNASSNAFIDNAFPLTSLKGLNINNHGWNPWIRPTHCFNNPEGVDSFRIDIIIATLLEFYNAITRLKNASSNAFIYNAFPLTSLKGLNINNHGWNPWIAATHCFNNPEGVEHQKAVQ